MSTNIERFLLRLSEKAMKLRLQQCPKFDIRSINPLTNEDKAKLEKIRTTAGWDQVDFRVDGRDHVVEYRMNDIDKIDLNAIPVIHSTTYI